MIRILAAAAALAGPAPDAALLQDRDAAARPAMLIVGAPHFGNPGQDVGNPDMPDVLDEGRQREIEAVVDRLAAFRPTHVAVEVGSGNQARLDRLYADYRAGRHKLRPGEIDQIAMRLAARLRLERIHAVDWNEMPPGGEADWDYDAYARANGHGPRLEAVTAASRRQAAASGARARCTDVGQWLRDANAAEGRIAAHRPYFDYALIGDARRSPGATWVGNWYARNLRIFANLVRLADAPEDRLLVLYGAGHGYLLDRFARESGAFAVEDTLAYLPQPRPAGGPGCG